MSRRASVFVGTCVELPARDLERFDDTEREITYGTFRRWVGAETVRELDLTNGVPLRRDWGVSFGKGKWKGRTAVCAHLSAVHHIWAV